MVAFATFLTIIFSVIISLDASKYYCINGAEQSFQMRGNSDAEDVLISTIRTKNSYLAFQKCSWEVLMTNMSVPQNIILRARLRPMSQLSGSSKESLANGSICSASVKATLQSLGHSDAVFEFEWGGDQDMMDDFIVLPITNRSQKMLVSVTTGPTESKANCKRIELVLSSVVKGYCGRNMLLHNTKCFLVSHTEFGMDHASQTKLTGFANLGEIRDLLNANVLRMDQHPYTRPLNLISPAARVAVFRSPGSEQTVYWRYENGKCHLETANFTDLPAANSSALQCLSLHVQPNDQLSLEFSDCHKPMRTLLSFPESPLLGGESLCDTQSLYANQFEFESILMATESQRQDSGLHPDYYLALNLCVVLLIFLCYFTVLYLCFWTSILRFTKSLELF